MDKYKIIWRPEAQLDLIAHITFLSNVSMDAALELRKVFFEEVNALSFFPERNPSFEMPNGFPFIARKKVVNNRYLILYVIDKGDVKIYRILDTRKQFEYLM